MPVKEMCAKGGESKDDEESAECCSHATVA